MLSKEKLIELMQEGLKREEDAIELYSHHIQNTLEFSGLGKEKEVMIKNKLDILIEESHGHRGSFEEIIDYIENSDKEDF